MPDQKIYIIGYDEIVLMLGLLGIEGIIVESIDQFRKKFDELIKNPNIGMIIIAIELPDDLIDFLIDFKLKHLKPFVFFLPDIFQDNIESNDIILNKILKIIKKLIL